MINTISTLNTVMELRANIPAFIQIRDYYKKLIEIGAIKEGEYLPSVRDVSLQIGVNPNTVQRAFTLLIQDGYISPIIGKGNRVNNIENMRENNKLKEYINQIIDKGYSLEEIQKEIENMKKGKE